MKRSLIPLLVLLSACCPYLALAQTGRADVQGMITDSLDASLAGATVVLLAPGDSALVSYGITRDDGSFRLRRVPYGRYLLQVSFVGYLPSNQEIRVEAPVVEVGPVILHASVAELDALVVTSEHVPLLIKRDTIVYNAAAFNIKPNATVEDLLKKLPGIEVQQDGTIRAQGETVEQVLVDGKEFFGNDPRIATQNLPADAVDNVEVYDKQSDLAEFSGIEDGEERKTINLALNEESKNGYFGNAYGGYGNDEFDSRYAGKASVNRFSPSTQLSFIGNVNNVNDQGFALDEYMNFLGGIGSLMGGGGRIELSNVPVGMEGLNGFSMAASGGVNFNRDFNERTSLRSSYFVSSVDNDQDRLVNQQQLVGLAQASRSVERSNRHTLAQNHRLNANVKHAFGNRSDVRVRADATLADSRLDSPVSRSVRNAADILVNENNTLYDASGLRTGGTASLTYRQKLSEEGRTLVAEARSAWNDGANKGNLQALSAFYDNAGNVLTTEEIRQFQSQFSNTFSHRERLSLTQPLGKRQSLLVFGEHRRLREDQDQQVFDRFDTGDALNTSLSSSLAQSYTYNKAGAKLRFVRPRGSFSIGTDIQSASLDGDILTGSNPSAAGRVQRSFVRWLPSARYVVEFSGQKSLDMQYESSTQEPSMRELQPFTDNSDPINTYTGNPSLQPEYSHAGVVHFMLFDAFSFTSLFAVARLQYTTDKISRARTIDDAFRQAITPINVDRDVALSSQLHFSTPVRAVGAKVNVVTETMFNRGLEYINDVENETRILRQGVDMSFENRNKERVDMTLGARYTFNVNRYALNPELDQNYVNRTYYADLTYNLGNLWRFSSRLDYRLYADDVFGGGQKVPLWSAEISRMLMRNRAELQLIGLDLLNRNIGVNFTNTSNSIQEERINSLGRYVMLKFVYNLSNI